MMLLAIRALGFQLGVELRSKQLFLFHFAMEEVRAISILAEKKGPLSSRNVERTGSGEHQVGGSDDGVFLSELEPG